MTKKTTNDNMYIWEQVSKTDPDHTKRVEQRGGFTAIDAMYQIQSATQIFGPAGDGWGWEFSDPMFPGNNTVVIKCKLWHKGGVQPIEQYGQKSLNVFNKKLGKEVPDEDAFKKAATDALTKCLSYLGFNADVFLGRFDDNKYVEQVREEFKEAKEDPKARDIFERLSNKMLEINDADEFKQWWTCDSIKIDREELNELSPDKYVAVVNAMKIKAEEFRGQ